ncbi:MAG: type II toxin-antitoxin system VapC family toxin [Bacteroidetes bacterium]|nr:type II toxin-antitoxin system VapC family toxin [Bacteroidota bacterium]
MCAILDANVVHEAFESNSSEAGKQFFDWLNTGKGRLVVGGKLFEELFGTSKKFTEWARRAQITGRMRRVKDDQVNAIAEGLNYKSDDCHIIALAQVSGARLLYSNDKALHKDFKNRELINNPGGKVYSTPAHKHLLEREDLCQVNP